MTTEGLVFDIKRFSVHDGPGIRTTVFVKGCSLRCGWCQNPEGQDLKKNLWHFPAKCIACMACVKACPEDALTYTGHIEIDREKCTNCGACTDVCPTEAIVFDSRLMTVDEVMTELLKDRVFYQESGGGITISGGDPLGQHSFVKAILSSAKENGLHTVLETCLQGRKTHLEALLPSVDLIFTDIKILDPVEHERYTGFRNDTILENFRFIADRQIPVVVRIPLIPEITAREENLRGIARFVSTTAPDVPIELINYNPLARDKYRIMSRPYPVPQDVDPFTDADVNRFREIILSEGAVLYDET